MENHWIIGFENPSRYELRMIRTEGGVEYSEDSPDHFYGQDTSDVFETLKSRMWIKELAVDEEDIARYLEDVDAGVVSEPLVVARVEPLQMELNLCGDDVEVTYRYELSRVAPIEVTEDLIKSLLL